MSAESTRTATEPTIQTFTAGTVRLPNKGAVCEIVAAKPTPGMGLAELCEIMCRSNQGYVLCPKNLRNHMIQPDAFNQVGSEGHLYFIPYDEVHRDGRKFDTVGASQFPLKKAGVSAFKKQFIPAMCVFVLFLQQMK